MNHLLYLLFKKSKLNRLIYNICKDKAHGLIEINAKNVQRAETLLNSIQPDPKKLCICVNKVAASPQYDLQIIVPAYNVEQYIKECLDSVLAQQTSFSYIVKVINDGSTDGTSKYLEHYRHIPQIQIIYQENKGLSGARNTGLKDIEARYVMFLDSDDKLLPGAIQTLLERAQETDADIVEGSSVKFFGALVTKRFCHADAKEVSMECLFGFAWGKVYKAAMFARVGFPEGYWFEDTLCAFILHPMAKKVSTISHQVYAYRTNFKGISRTFRGKTKCLDTFYICEQLFHDRADLDNPLGEDQAEKVARQFRLNAYRIASLKREDVNRALFTLQSYLFQKYFSNITKYHSSPVQALLVGDYQAFKLQMTWI